MSASNLDLAVSYTPPGCEVSLTLATVRNVALLVAVLQVAIAEADAGIKIASDPLARRALKTQRQFLSAALAEIVGREDCPAGVM